jgi:nicotinate phosphoribosyltransferase
MPIIKSLLDSDFYKFTMGQVIFKRHPDVPVRFALKNRTKGIRLADIIPEQDLRAELDHVRSLHPNKTELHYLRGTNEYSSRMFCEPYLEFFGQLKLPPYELEKVDGNYKLEFPGRWAEATYWEIPALVIVNELYYRGLMRNFSTFERDTVRAEGISKLAQKIKILKNRPDITFCDFGTRRRFGRDWQDYVVQTLTNELPSTQFLGTSNTYLAMKYGLLPMGTAAHEMDMGYSGIFHGSDEEIKSSHQRVLRDWWEEYSGGLSVALTDTYGTDFFFSDMTWYQALDWKGLRQDSGDPFVFVDKALAFYYEACGICPEDKLIVFSDGLDVETIVKLADYCKGKIKCTFGWGTNLTNDLGFPALSLIVKLMESNGHGTVKLSDNLAKALGKPEDIERFKRIFDYTGAEYKECKY